MVPDVGFWGVRSDWVCFGFADVDCGWGPAQCGSSCEGSIGGFRFVASFHGAVIEMTHCCNGHPNATGPFH